MALFQFVSCVCGWLIAAIGFSSTAKPHNSCQWTPLWSISVASKTSIPDAASQIQGHPYTFRFARYTGPMNVRWYSLNPDHNPKNRLSFPIRSKSKGRPDRMGGRSVKSCRSSRDGRVAKRRQDEDLDGHSAYTTLPAKLGVHF